MGSGDGERDMAQGAGRYMKTRRRCDEEARRRKCAEQGTIARKHSSIVPKKRPRRRIARFPIVLPNSKREVQHSSSTSGTKNPCLVFGATKHTFVLDPVVLEFAVNHVTCSALRAEFFLFYRRMSAPCTGELLHSSLLKVLNMPPNLSRSIAHKCFCKQTFCFSLFHSRTIFNLPGRGEKRKPAFFV